MGQKVRVWVEERARSQQAQRQFSWLTGAALLSGLGLVVGGVWVAVQLMVDPSAIGWINQMMPILNQREENPQTLAQIQQEISQAKQVAEAPIALKEGSSSDLLLPIFSSMQCDRSNLASTCGYLQELRVYRPVNLGMSLLGKELRYELRDRVAVTGLPEAMVIAPLTDAAIVGQGSGRLLPLTEITALEGKAPEKGNWFLLSSEWQRGTTHVHYGRVMYYDADRARLEELLSWTSPANQLPVWQQVTGSAASELVVNQTLGLEPQYQVYQVTSSRFAGESLQLDPIALTQSASRNRTYQYGLLLAKNGLWRSALRTLQALKQKEAKQWSPMAQAQLDLIALHAQITQAQAEREWASPTQQVMAQLIDDRWSKALNLLKTARTDGYDVNSFLKVNANRFWKRIEVGLRVSPKQPDLQRWGLLLQAIQHDRTTALNWLQKQQMPLPEKNKSPIREILTLLDPIDLPKPAAFPNPDAASSSINSPINNSSSINSQIIGSVKPLQKINPGDWLTLDRKPLQQTAAQMGYRIQVLGFRDNQWQEPPFANRAGSDRSSTQLAQRLWQRLHLGNQSMIQIAAWTDPHSPKTIEATIQAVRMQNGKLELLAIGSPLSGLTSDVPALALTPETIEWLRPLNTLTLAELHQQQSTWAEALLTTLWEEFPPEETGSNSPTSKMLLQAFGAWSVQLMELTGDNQPEAVLTLESEQGNRTLIFSKLGSVIYSDREMPETVTAIVRLAQTPQAMLILQAPEGYQLRQWSAQRQQFE